MITAGIDAGAKNTKTVILKDNEIIAKHSALSGFDQKASTEESFNGAIEKAGLISVRSLPNRILFGPTPATASATLS